MGIFGRNERFQKRGSAVPPERLLVFLAHYKAVNPMYGAGSRQEFEDHPDHQKVRAMQLELEGRFVERRTGFAGGGRAQCIFGRRAAHMRPLTWNPQETGTVYPFQWYDRVLGVNDADDGRVLEKMDLFLRLRYLAGAAPDERRLFMQRAGPSFEVLFNPNSRKMMTVRSEALSTAFCLVLVPNVRPAGASGGLLSESAAAGGVVQRKE